MEHRQINENYRKIAEQLIQEELELSYIKDSKVKVVYLESDQQKKNGENLVLGECEKVAAKNSWAINYDFTITLFVKNCVGLNADQLKILLFHELLHIGITQKEDDEEAYSIVKHDLEDFKLIIDKFGTDWARKKEQ